jgi:hypothetical protein
VFQKRRECLLFNKDCTAGNKCGRLHLDALQRQGACVPITSAISDCSKFISSFLSRVQRRCNADKRTDSVLGLKPSVLHLTFPVQRLHNVSASVLFGDFLFCATAQPPFRKKSLHNSSLPLLFPSIASVNGVQLFQI